MSEFEASNTRQLTIGEYAAILRRRIWWIIVPTLLGPIVGYAISLKLPSRYTSQTLVLVEEQKVPESFVKPVVTDLLEQRLATMQEQILSRSRLQPIVDRFGLFGDRPNLSIDDKIELTRKATEIKPVRPDFGSPGIEGFYVSFTAQNAKLAQQVCGEITSMFMEENLRVREQRSQGTTDFLGSQLDDAKRDLDEQDAKLANFKRKYIGQLPGEDQGNFNMLNSLNSQLDAATQALNQLQQTRTYTESMLSAQLQSWQNLQASNGSSATPESLDQQLAKDQEKLSELESKYTDTHPDVIRLKKDIEVLRKKIQSQGNSAHNPDKEVRTGPEPAQVQQIRAQLVGIQQGIKDKEKEQAKIQQQIQTYQARIQLSPVVEEEYKKLTRDHDTALEFYNDLLKKKNQSEMATDLERRQEGEQFRVLDPPNLPDRPTFPKRPLFAAGGLGAGLALGLGIVVLLEFTKKSIRNDKDVLFYLQMTTLATIPNLDADSERRTSKGSDRARHKGRGSLKAEAV